MRHIFFHRSFSWARLQANSCAQQLSGFCFSVSSQKIFGNGVKDFLCPSRNAAVALGAEATRFWMP